MAKSLSQIDFLPGGRGIRGRFNVVSFKTPKSAGYLDANSTDVGFRLLSDVSFRSAQALPLSTCLPPVKSLFRSVCSS